MSRIGLWIIGAHGGVATTVAVGLRTLANSQSAAGLSGVGSGLVSQLPQFESLDLAAWENIVLGGHDIRDTTSLEEAKKLAYGTVPAIHPGFLEGADSFFADYDDRIRPGIMVNVGQTIEGLSSRNRVAVVDGARAAVKKVQTDLQEFAKANECERVIVVNLASTEPPVDGAKLPEDWDEFEQLLDDSSCPLPSSTLYAIASLELGYPFINFTPSLGNCPPAIDQLAISKGACHTGHDGKTGETFLKSVLAPAFANRNLQIMSWVGHNIFGNMDGQVLDDPINKQTKVTSKDRLLGQMLGYDPQTHVSIEYIKSLGDWKTAWDHIHFRGFLGTPMTMQFTWQGCDSILAAPLVLDLFRFVDLASRRGETGILTTMASFFKSPLGTDENDFSAQFQTLLDWAQGQSGKA